MRIESLRERLRALGANPRHQQRVLRLWSQALPQRSGRRALEHFLHDIEVADHLHHIFDSLRHMRYPLEELARDVRADEAAAPGHDHRVATRRHGSLSAAPAVPSAAS